jgi:CheY-like chemotaxis protein
MKKKVLIIEDHPETVEVMETIMKPLGVEVLIAYDGIRGGKLAVSGKPDLILLDIMMPEMNGFEVCRRLKADPETAKIPIVIVSVRSSEDSLENGKKCGADEYITKPFEPKKLLEVVGRYVGIS